MAEMLEPVTARHHIDEALSGSKSGMRMNLDDMERILSRPLNGGDVDLVHAVVNATLLSVGKDEHLKRASLRAGTETGKGGFGR
jgi:hypothetical protein